MKKLLVVVLTVILAVSLAVPAVATVIDTPSEQPFLVSTTSKDAKCTFLNEASELSEAELEELTAAEDAELEAGGKEMKTRDLFYFYTSEPADAVFYVPDNPHLIAKQFIDGKWVKLDTEVNVEDVTITVKNAVDAPMILYTVGKDSPTGTEESTTTTALLPVFVSSTAEKFELYSVNEEYKLESEGRQAFLDAQDALRSAVPAGMSARYFFYVYTSSTCTAVFRIENASEVMFKQYVDGQWTELESTMNGDGIVTVEGVVIAPMAIFTK